MRLPSRLAERPFFLALLPLAFAAHGLSVQYGRARVADALTVAALFFGGLVLLAALLWLLLRRWRAAALTAAFLGLLQCYWSYPVLRLKAAFPTSGLVRLPVLLAVAGGLWAVAVWRLVKARPEQRARLALFLNALFGVLLLVDSTTAAMRYRAAVRRLPVAWPAAAVRAHPPVFVLLFDEYGSPASLERNGLSTDRVEAFLRGEGFFVATRARSAYPITHFSLAAALNGAYLFTDTGHPVTLRDYNDALVCIRHARLPQAFQEAGYRLCNRSVFWLGDAPPFEGHSPLVEGTEVLLAGTFWSEVACPLWLKRFAPHRLEETYFDGIRRHAALARAVARDAATPGPVFSYAHFFLPHAPFVYDARGRRLSFEASLQQSAANDPQGYAANLHQATKLLKQCAAAIRQQRPDALILVLGDHGYRNEALPGNDTARFQALCAVSYPDRNYAGWTDSTGLLQAFQLLAGKALGIRRQTVHDRTISLQDQAGLDW